MNNNQTPPNDLARFVLVEPAIVDLTGHYYEYGVRLLQAAERAGYKPVLATNRRVTVRERVPYEIHPVYRYGYWPEARRLPFTRYVHGLSAATQRLAVWFKCAALFSVFGMLAARRRPLPILRTALRLPADYGWKTALLVALLSPLIVPALAVAIPLRSLHRAIELRAARRQRPSPKARWQALLARAAGLRQRLGVWSANRLHCRAFYRDTSRLVRRLGMRHGDVVFVLTMNDKDLFGLVAALKKNPRSKLASWHLMFRRNIYHGAEPDYPNQDEQMRPLRNAFREFQKRLADWPVFLHTDTEQLTSQYNRLGVAPFATLPIPVSKEFHIPPKSATTGDPLRIVYIGDARSEKGYHYLPRLVQDIWSTPEYRDAIEFVFQSNISSACREPETFVARAQLQSLRNSRLEVITEPLASDDYTRLTLSGDVILVPYDRVNYYARSSGVFAEAAAAGIPMIVPAGSWMAVELADAIYDYHRGLDEHRLDDAKSTSLLAVSPRQPELGGASAKRGGVRPANRYQVRVPHGATHLRIMFEGEGNQAGRFAEIAIEQYTPRGRRAKRAAATVGGTRRLRGSTLAPLARRAQVIQFTIDQAFAPGALLLENLRVDFLHAPRGLPQSAAGVVYSDPASLADCVREIVDWRPHYLATASDLSRHWRSYHTPENVVHEMRRAVASSRAKQAPSARGAPEPELRPLIRISNHAA